MPTAAASRSVFDPVEAVSRCAEDPELLEVFFDQVPEEARLQLAAMRVALAERDASGLHAAAHRLKGSLVLLAAEPSSELARRIEAAAREGDIDRCGPLIDELARAIDELNAAIADHRRGP